MEFEPEPSVPPVSERLVLACGAAAAVVTVVMVARVLTDAVRCVLSLAG